MHPDAKALSLLERETLQTITHIGTFAKLGSISSDATKYTNTGIWTQKGQVDAHLSFEVTGGLRSDKGQPARRRRFDISALVTSNKANAPVTTNASYSVVLCDGTDPQTSTVIRKFHFDYEAIETRHGSEPKPTTHMQICGEFSGHHINTLGYQANQIEGWHPAFEKPRIPVQPTSIALLLNWIFLEFQSDPDINAILKDPQWTAIVLKAETQILLPYFQKASEFLEAGLRRATGFTRSHQYGIA